MIKAPILENESNRLSELLSFCILDTPPDQGLDDITSLASAICGTPIALVSLIDKERQWFKSRAGMEEKETPRDISFCGHAIHQVDIFEIPDASKDERFSDNPLVTGKLNVQFYAGVPLKTDAGYNLGTLCVLDHKPRHLDNIQKECLRVLARHVIRIFEQRKSSELINKHFFELQSLSQSLIRREELLLQTHKMAALGDMAGGIAHEINNPLAVILGKLHKVNSLIKVEVPDRELVSSELSRVKAAAERIVKIIKGLRQFARADEKEERKQFTLKTLMDEVLGLTASRMNAHGIDFKVGEFSESVVLSAQLAQLTQALINILGNAHDAALEPGMEGRVPEVSLSAVLQVSEGKVTIECKDNGLGIHSDHSKKIFDPFFSLKSEQKSVGLGLSVAKKIIEENGGSVSFHSQPGHTVFRVSLPIVRE